MMNDCPRDFECFGCIFRNTLDCPFENDDMKEDE